MLPALQHPVNNWDISGTVSGLYYWAKCHLCIKLPTPTLLKRQCLIMWFDFVSAIDTNFVSVGWSEWAKHLCCIFRIRAWVPRVSSELYVRFTLLTNNSSTPNTQYIIVGIKTDVNSGRHTQRERDLNALQFKKHTNGQNMSKGFFGIIHLRILSECLICPLNHLLVLHYRLCRTNTQRNTVALWHILSLWYTRALSFNPHYVMLMSVFVLI